MTLIRGEDKWGQGQWSLKRADVATWAVLTNVCLDQLGVLFCLGSACPIPLLNIFYITLVWRYH